jgi:hypothetical protein
MTCSLAIGIISYLLSLKSHFPNGNTATKNALLGSIHSRKCDSLKRCRKCDETEAILQWTIYIRINAKIRVNRTENELRRLEQRFYILLGDTDTISMVAC